MSDRPKYIIGFEDGTKVDTLNVTFIEKLRHGDDYHVSNGPGVFIADTGSVGDPRIHAAIRESGIKLSHISQDTRSSSSRLRNTI